MTYKPPSSSQQQTKPKLTVEEIQDLFLRKNFQSLREYFLEQNQLVDFKHFELSFTEATKNFKVQHGLKRAPLDILVTKITGAGNVTFNYGLFDSSSLDLTVTGKCKIRFFAGTYWNSKDTTSDDKDAAQTFSSSGGTSGASPSGSIVAFGGTTAPSGWLMCDGTSYATADYADLAKAIGNAFGGTPGATFRVPDLRGLFIRGADNAAGIDPNASARIQKNGGSLGDAVGSYQADAYQGHWHSFFRGDQWNTGASGDLCLGTTGTQQLDNIRVRNSITDGVNGTPRTSSETRPKNLSANYIIKT